MLRQPALALLTQNDVRCRQLLNELLADVSDAAGLSYPGFPSRGALSDEFQSWFGDALATRSVDLERSRVLSRAATWQVSVSLALRLVAERAWLATASAISG